VAAQSTQTIDRKATNLPQKTDAYEMVLTRNEAWVKGDTATNKMNPAFVHIDFYSSGFRLLMPTDPREHYHGEK
jgi:hypothetical protein